MFLALGEASHVAHLAHSQAAGMVSQQLQRLTSDVAKFGLVDV
jgi:hypothetical protein